MEGYTWTEILLYFFSYCFMGWVFESIYVSIMERKLTNRGFLRGPMIPIYGFGAMMIVFATTPFRGNYVAEYLAGLIAATIFELAVGLTMEAIFKVKYWDYSHKPFQYKGYICLESSLCWGFLSVIAAEVLQVRLEQMVALIPSTAATILALTLLLLFCTDTVVSVRDAWGVRAIVIAMEKMRAELDRLQEDLEERSEEFVQMLEERAKAKKAELDAIKDELELMRTEQREQLAQEIAQLRGAIEKEQRERELARAQFAARVERDVIALQQKLELEQSGLYEKLQQVRADHSARLLSQVARENLLLQSLEKHEEQLRIQLQKRGGILRRNPNAAAKTLGNVRRHLERQKKRTAK